MWRDLLWPGVIGAGFFIFGAVGLVLALRPDSYFDDHDKGES